MLSYTGQRDLFAKLVNNPNSASVKTTYDELAAQYIRQILAKRKWWFLEQQFTTSTTASTQAVKLPGHIERILSPPTITVGSIIYTPREAPSREFWDRLNQIPYSSDIPEWWIQYDGNLLIYPTPSAANSVSFNAKKKVVDLSVADFSTGTIATATNASTSVAGTGTSWTAGLGGFHIRITAGAAANLGDHVWYEIASIDSSTTLTLVNPYGGTSISGGSAAYIIGQMTLIPEAYDHLPLYMALETYFTSIDPNSQKSSLYTQLRKETLAAMEADHTNKTSGLVIDEGHDTPRIQNPNLYVLLS